MKNQEVEIRFWLQDDANLLNWLNENAEFLGEYRQKDIYFQPKLSPFIKTDQSNEKDADEWLRIRVLNDDGAELCYKRWHRDKRTKKSLYADEIETKFDNKDNLVRILRFLGYVVISEVVKTRKSWKYGNFKIERDIVRGLGTFYEVEFKGEIANPEEGNFVILDFLKKLNLSKLKIIDRGYPWMQWNQHWKDMISS